MVVAAVLGAVIAWRGSVVSSEAGDAYDHGIEELIQREQAEAQNESKLLHDLGMHAQYQEHVRAWRVLDQQSDEVRPENAALADDLARQAQERLALARALQPYFLAAAPDLGDDAGEVAYDREFVRRYLRSVTPELRELKPDETFAAGRRLNDRVVRLVGLVLLSVIALFFLTLAELTRGQLRVLLAVLGGVVLVGAGGLFAFVGFA